MSYEKINQNQDMGISGKTNRLKDRGEGIWTVSSSFSGNTSVKVTLILLDPASGNYFYNKHVQRRGETTQFVMDLRNPRRTGGDLGYSMDQVGGTVLTKNTNKSTTILLSRIDQSHMLFKIAEALYQASTKIPLNVYTEHLTDVDFLIGNSVITVDNAKTISHSDISIGGTKVADTGTAMTFNVSHCVQA